MIISICTGGKDQQKIVKINAKIHFLSDSEYLRLENHTLVVNKNAIKEYRNLFELLKDVGNDFANTELAVYKKIEYIAIKSKSHRYPIFCEPFRPFSSSFVQPFSYTDSTTAYEKLSSEVAMRRNKLNEFLKKEAYFDIGREGAEKLLTPYLNPESTQFKKFFKDYFNREGSIKNAMFSAGLLLLRKSSIKGAHAISCLRVETLYENETILKREIAHSSIYEIKDQQGSGIKWQCVNPNNNSIYSESDSFYLTCKKVMEIFCKKTQEPDFADTPHFLFVKNEDSSNESPYQLIDFDELEKELGTPVYHKEIFNIKFDENNSN